MKRTYILAHMLTNTENTLSHVHTLQAFTHAYKPLKHTSQVFQYLYDQLLWRIINEVCNWSKKIAQKNFDSFFLSN